MVYTYRMRTDHSIAIAHLRALDTIVDIAAADLLELHDRTSLNLHEAPNLLAFVEDRLFVAQGVPNTVTPNYV
jgi:hypothetical protein